MDRLGPIDLRTSGMAYVLRARDTKILYGPVATGGCELGPFC